MNDQELQQLIDWINAEVPDGSTTEDVVAMADGANLPIAAKQALSEVEARRTWSQTELIDEVRDRAGATTEAGEPVGTGIAPASGSPV